MTKARKSVAEVMVIPIPANANVFPKRSGTVSPVSGMVSLHEVIKRNISSTPMPENSGNKMP